MKQKYLLRSALTLVAFGLLGMIYSFVMDVTLDKDTNIVNIHLLSQQQNSLIFGGILFISGIILLAINSAGSQRTLGYIRDQPKDASPLKKMDAIVLRLTLGILGGGWTALSLFLTTGSLLQSLGVVDMEDPSYGAYILIFVASVAYCLSAKPAKDIATTLLSIYSKCAICSQLSLIAYAIFWPNSLGPTDFVILIVLLAVLSIPIFFNSRHKKSDWLRC